MVNEKCHMKSNPQIIETVTVPPLSEKTRLQDAVALLFRKIRTKSGLKKAIKNKRVKIANTVLQTGSYLYGGEVIDLYASAIQQVKPEIHINLEVLFEDDYMAVVNKPAGITVSGNKKWTLENALPFNLSKSTLTNALLRPEPIHRLDHPTSGALLIGKTSEAVIALNKLFEEKRVEKVYYAITQGKSSQQGIIDAMVDDKQARTQFYKTASVPSSKFVQLNLMRLEPATGRKHQLRKHLSGMSTPILGDKIYGNEGEILFGNGLYLHAFTLSFIHPFTRRSISVQAHLPKKFSKLFPETVTKLNAELQ